MQKYSCLLQQDTFLIALADKAWDLVNTLVWGILLFKGDSILIQDLYRNKYIAYDLYSNSHREISYDVYHKDIISFDNIAYLISNYEGSDYGDFNLFKFDLATSSVISSEIPFNRKQIDKSGYGLRKYASKYNNEATLIYPLNDTIYILKEDTVCPFML